MEIQLTQINPGLKIENVQKWRKIYYTCNEIAHMVTDHTISTIETNLTRRTALRMGGGALAAGLAGCLGANGGAFQHEHDWPTFAHDAANTGHTRAQGPGDPELLWTKETGIVTTTPAVVEGVVYVGDVGGTVYALDAASGDEEWTYDVGEPVQGTPAVDDGAIYACGQNTAFRLSSDGSEEWSVELGVITHPPTIVGDTLFVPTHGTLYALDPESGEERWSAPNRSYAPAIADAAALTFRSEDDTDYAVALDAETGEESWTYEWEGGGTLSLVSPSTGAGSVFFGTGGREVLALDTETGEEAWRADAGRFALQSPVVGDETVYLGIEPMYPHDPMRGEGTGSSVLALNAQTGDLSWRLDTGALGTAGSLADETLYTRTLGGLSALDAGTGETQWEFDAPFGLPWDGDGPMDDPPQVTEEFTSQPAVVDGALFVGSPAGGIYAVGEA